EASMGVVETGDQRRADEIIRGDGGRDQRKRPTSLVMYCMQADREAIKTDTPGEDCIGERRGNHVPPEEAAATLCLRRRNRHRSTGARRLLLSGTVRPKPKLRA